MLIDTTGKRRFKLIKLQPAEPVVKTMKFKLRRAGVVIRITEVKTCV